MDYCSPWRLVVYGESGIRTHGMNSHTHAFQACPFDHSGISPTGVPGRNRTDNLLLRRQLLYPVELWDHNIDYTSLDNKKQVVSVSRDNLQTPMDHAASA